MNEPDDIYKRNGRVYIRLKGETRRIDEWVGSTGVTLPYRTLSSRAYKWMMGESTMSVKDLLYSQTQHATKLLNQTDQEKYYAECRKWITRKWTTA